MSEKAGAKVVVVMPARNAAVTLEQTISGIPPGWVDEIILVDDKSTDDTVALARRIPQLHVVWHPHNVGYGGNQKTCYLHALNAGADVVVMLHPDGQYEPTLIPDLIAPILDGRADLVLGSRLAEPGAAIAGGMPRWKWIGNRGLTWVENRAFRRDYSEYHTGYRAFSADFLRSVPFGRNSDGFVFDQEMFAQIVSRDARVVEQAIPTRYFLEASSVSFRDSVAYGLRTLVVLARFRAHERGRRWALLTAPAARLEPETATATAGK